MTLATQMESDLDILFSTDDFAISVTYAGTAIPGLVDYHDDPDMEPGGRSSRATLEVRVSDVAAPAYRDTVVIDGNTWHVLGVMSGDGHVWTLEVLRDERIMPR